MKIFKQLILGFILSLTIIAQSAYASKSRLTYIVLLDSASPNELDIVSTTYTGNIYVIKNGYRGGFIMSTIHEGEPNVGTTTVKYVLNPYQYCTINFKFPQNSNTSTIIDTYQCTGGLIFKDLYKHPTYPDSTYYYISFGVARV